MLGSCYLLTGIVALVQAAGHGRPELGALAAVLGVLVLAGAISVIAVAVHRLREIEGLPPTAQRVSWVFVVARVSLLSGLPIATVVALSITSAGSGWILGLVFAVLGGAICAAAALAVHVEYLCGARVWRSNRRFYFAR